MALKAFTFAQRPELVEQAALFNDIGWPAFMCQDSNEQRYWPRLETSFPEFQLMLCADDQVVAVGHAIPLYWDGTVSGLPDGWGAALAQGVHDFRQERPVNCASALSVVVHPDYQRKGLSRLVLEAMRATVKAEGINNLIAPVRPSLKQLYPFTTIEQYTTWRQPDGSPFDPWVRVHWRLGARVLAPAPESMSIEGSVSQWARWTGMEFPNSGEYLVPGALQPVKIDIAKGYGCYKDPNVWMHHALSPKSRSPLDVQERRRAQEVR